MDNADLYVTLEVHRSASDQEIKRAFRRLARRYHPDINPGDSAAEDRFKRISEAYDVLGDPKKRLFYDQNGFYTDGVLETDEWGVRFQGFDFSSPASGYVEFFDHLFRRGQRKAEPENGADIEHSVCIGFRDSIRGLPMTVQFSRKRACEPCGNAGYLQLSESACSTCGGGGQVTQIRGHLRFSVTCADCGGVGRRRAICPQCQGEGRRPALETLTIQIPPGVGNGARVTERGMGEAGRFGGQPGNFSLVVSVERHPFFERIGDNIHCSVPITISEAALGAKIVVPTLDGNAVLRVPPGTQSGQKLRLKGRGAPSAIDPTVRGDQYVEVRIQVPRILDERSKELLREFARLNTEEPRRSLTRDWNDHGASGSKAEE